MRAHVHALCICTYMYNPVLISYHMYYCPPHSLPDLHPEGSPELEVGPLLKVLLANDRVLPIPRDSNRKGRENGILDEATRQLKPQRQLRLKEKKVIDQFLLPTYVYMKEWRTTTP